MERSAISFGKIEVNVVSAMEEPRGKPKPETPFQILILGDFSAGSSRGLVAKTPTDRRPILVDRDNFDEVLARLGVEIHLPMGKKAPPLKLRFRELEDFHPTNSSNGWNRWKRCGKPVGSWPTPGLSRPRQRNWGAGQETKGFPWKGKNLPPREPSQGPQTFSAGN